MFDGSGSQAPNTGKAMESHTHYWLSTGAECTLTFTFPAQKNINAIEVVPFARGTGGPSNFKVEVEDLAGQYVDASGGVIMTGAPPAYVAGQAWSTQDATNAMVSMPVAARRMRVVVYKGSGALGCQLNEIKIAGCA